jgi:hypothetical protein
VAAASLLNLSDCAAYALRKLAAPYNVSGWTIARLA